MRAKRTVVDLVCVWMSYCVKTSSGTVALSDEPTHGTGMKRPIAVAFSNKPNHGTTLKTSQLGKMQRIIPDSHVRQYAGHSAAIIPDTHVR